MQSDVMAFFSNEALFQVQIKTAQYIEKFFLYSG